MSVLVVEHLSLDGVLQGPARPDEDPSGGFRHSGWAMAAADDPEPGAAMGRAVRPGFAWLFGRRTYDDVLTHWNAVGGPFRDSLNQATKYVVTTDPELPWPHSVQVTGDVPAEVARLRRAQDLVVMGSGPLVRELLEHDLVDELLLFVHPVLLGSGQRLFGDAPDPRRLRLVEASPTASGVLITTYRRD